MEHMGFLAGKALPPDVADPIRHILSWFLGGALIVMTIALMSAAGRLYSARRGGDWLEDAGGHIATILFAAITASCCTAIALAVTPS